MNLSHKNFSKNLIIVIAGVIVIGYIIFNFRVFIAGPKIEVTSPENGSTVTEPLIDVVGLATNISQIQMNNNTIFLSENGEFKEFLLLNPGYNIISIDAKDKFGRSVSRKIEVVYQGEKIIGQAVLFNASSTNDLEENASSTDEIEVENEENSSLEGDAESPAEP